MKKIMSLILLLCILVLADGCGSMQPEKEGVTESMASEKTEPEYYTVDSKITDVIQDSSFGDYGRLIFPVDEGYYSGETLGQLQLTWYNKIAERLQTGTSHS